MVPVTRRRRRRRARHAGAGGRHSRLHRNLCGRGRCPGGEYDGRRRPVPCCQERLIASVTGSGLRPWLLWTSPVDGPIERPAFWDARAGKTSGRWRCRCGVLSAEQRLLTRLRNARSAGLRRSDRGLCPGTRRHPCRAIVLRRLVASRLGGPAPRGVSWASLALCCWRWPELWSSQQPWQQRHRATRPRRRHRGRRQGARRHWARWPSINSGRAIACGARA